MDSQRSKHRSGKGEYSCWNSKNGIKSPWQQASSIWSASMDKIEQNPHAQVCRTDLAVPPAEFEFRGSSASPSSVSPRRSRGWSNSARIPRRLSLPRPSLGLRGPRAIRGIPRRIPRRLSSSPLLPCLRGARAVLRRPRADREGSAGRLSALSPRTVVAEFREPRELRGDSDWAGVWLGLRVRFGLVPTAKFYCSANSNAFQILNKIPEKFLKQF